MTCQHLNPRHPYRKCSLGLYGGRPTPENCKNCMAKGENTPEFVTALNERLTRSHPVNIPRVSGCCDSAKPEPDKL